MGILALLWIIGIALGWTVGQNYRGSPWSGAILGALFGPLFGPLLALGLSDARLKCAACMSPVHPDATICAACRSSLVEPEEEELPLAPWPPKVEPQRGWG